MKRYKYRYLILMIVLMILNVYQAHCAVKSVTYANKFFVYQQGGIEVERMPVYRGSD